MSTDPDASLLAPTGGKGPRHSYALHLAVLVREDNDAMLDVPCLTRRMVITASTANAAPAATGLFARLAADAATLKAGTALRDLPAGPVEGPGTPARTAEERTALAAQLRGHLSGIIADRGYTYRDADTFTLPLRALGANVIAELHPLQAGQRGTEQGAVVLDAGLHCPGTPETLRNIPEPKFDATAGDRAATRPASPSGSRSRCASSAPRTPTACSASSAQPQPERSFAPSTRRAPPRPAASPKSWTRRRSRTRRVRSWPYRRAARSRPSPSRPSTSR